MATVAKGADTKKRKYLLYRADDGRPDALKACAFFLSAAGCKNGGGCRFSHTEQANHQDGQNVNESKSSISKTKVKTKDKKDRDSQQASRSSSPIPDQTSKRVNTQSTPKRAPVVAPYRNGNGVNAAAAAPPPFPVMSTLPPPTIQHSVPVPIANPMETSTSAQPVEGKKKRLRERKFKEKEILKEEKKPFAITIPPPRPSVSQPVTVNTTTADDEESDSDNSTSSSSSSDSESEFLFNAVNIALADGRLPSLDTSQSPPYAPHMPPHHIQAFNPEYQSQSTIQYPVSTIQYPQSNAATTYQSNAVEIPTSKRSSKKVAHTESAQTGSVAEAQRLFSPSYMPLLQHLLPYVSVPQGAIGEKQPVRNPYQTTPNTSALSISDPFAALLPRASRPIPPPPSMHSSNNGISSTRNYDSQPISSSSFSSSSSSFSTSYAPSLYVPAEVQPTVMPPQTPLFDASQRVDYSTLPWKELEQRTKEHPRYVQDYGRGPDPLSSTFHSLGWVKTKATIATPTPPTESPSVFSVHCDTCDCIDPVTGAVEGEVLIRFSIVKLLPGTSVFSLQPIEDKLVSPELPMHPPSLILNEHGITEAMLAESRYTRRQAQALLLTVMSEDSVLIGYDLHAALRALKLDHDRVVDVAYLYPSTTCPNPCSSCREIARITMQGLPNGYVSFSSLANFYAIAVACSVWMMIGCMDEASVQNNAPVPSTTQPQGQGQGQPSLASQLLVHRIPAHMTETKIYSVVVQGTAVIPIKVMPIERGVKVGGTGKAVVVFATERHAALAFDSVTGKNRPDNQDRPQKRLYLKQEGDSGEKSGYVCICMR